MDLQILLNKLLEKAEEIGYPVLIRPSYVLGGRAMQIAYDERKFEIFFKRSNGSFCK